jgi:hypothetical protein
MSTIPSRLPSDIRESVAIGNIKSVGEQPAMLSNLAFANLVANNNLSQQNAVSNQQAMNQLTLTITGKTVNRISDLSPAEATAIQTLQSDNDLAEQLAGLKAAVKRNQ